MLTDDELDALCEIERRLRAESPELARLFHVFGSPPADDRHTRARGRVLVAAAVFAGLVLLGPRVLDEAEVTSRRSPPVRRTSRSSSCGARAVSDSGTAFVFRLQALIETGARPVHSVSRGALTFIGGK